MSSPLRASSNVMSGMTTPSDSVLMRIFSSAFSLRVEEAQDVGVVRRQVDRAGALARAELVGVAEAVFEQLHDGDDAGGLVLDLLDRAPASRMF
jgi:hypothetical protein